MQASHPSRSPLVTVIVPVYNAAPYLAACLDSVLAQTYGDFRVLCCDDASTDESPAILARYARRHTRLTLLRNEANRGLSGTYNRLLAAAETKYIAYIDADDMMHSQRLRYQVDFMEGNGDIDVLGTAIWLRPEGRGARIPLLTYYAHDHAIKTGLLFHTALASPTLMLRAASVRRSKIWQDEGLTGSAAQDYDFYVRLAPHVRFANLSQPLTYYRTHDKQMGAIGFDAQLDSAIVVSRRHLARFGIEAGADIIRIVKRHQALSAYQITDSQRERLSALMEQIKGVRAFYGYHGIDRRVWGDMCDMVAPFVSTRSFYSVCEAARDKKRLLIRGLACVVGGNILNTLSVRREVQNITRKTRRLDSARARLKQYIIWKIRQRGGGRGGSGGHG